MKDIKLSIVETYVSHWSWWQGARELMQNAIDTEEFSIDLLENSIIIISNGGKIPVNALLMGKTSKEGDDTKIGKFGEGMKLGFLVLLRNGASISMQNGDEVWTPHMVMDDTFGERVLCVSISPSHTDNPSERVKIVVDNIPADAMALIRKNYAPARDDLEVVVESEYLGKAYAKKNNHNCRLYVNGLFVTEMKGKYKFDYDFKPDTFVLDRDRDQASEFEVRWNSSRLLSESDDILMLANLGMEDYDDLEHYDNTSGGRGYYSTGPDEKSVAERAVDLFKEKYGYKAFPISENWTQERKRLVTELAIQKGQTPITVKKTAYHMLKKEFSVPQIIEDMVEFKALDYLEKFLTKHGRTMYSKPRKELEKTIHMLKVAKGKA